ncbi:Fe-S cluster assembly protein SufD [Rhizomicrobium electricum]|uniref:Fe-S cluster assembly protein SufD n=1 Tax=Rhizomicrobium electricum TaxID=480070 RepID=A0ABN1F8K6_9PROT|nr:Fe-S cluster assembly protein SufD [Rhizomicrobium electricum]NIJ46787.1 Fe-S cluster assembly protein SufD [Rhizomicrobium electricum]
MSAAAQREARRTEALDSFRVRGMPHRRFEHWRYSDLRAVLDAGQVAQAGTAKWNIEHLPEGVELFDLSVQDAPEWVMKTLGHVGNRRTMVEASLAFSEGGVALRVPKGKHIAEPIKLEIGGQGNLRWLIVLEQGASATVFEPHAHDAGYLRNVGVEITLAEGAELQHVRCAPLAPRSFTVELMALELAKHAKYYGHFANFGSRLSRTEAHIVLGGEGAEAHLSGVAVLGHEAHSDVTTHIEHAAGKTLSTQLFKHVAGGKSRAVYQGKITVRDGASGSDSRQTARALLMSPRAEADLKPELIIFNDDVKCAHGATVGDLDPESLFYLRSRGIPEKDARRLLINAFLEEAVDVIGNDTLKETIWHDIEAALPRAMEAAK